MKPWVVDTSVLLDIRIKDARFGLRSAKALEARLGEGLVISPVTFVEMAPAFQGRLDLLEKFLEELGVEWPQEWTDADTVNACRLWSQHVASKRAGLVLKRPLADIFIEAFAQRFRGLITRNPKDFSSVSVVVP